MDAEKRSHRRDFGVTEVSFVYQKLRFEGRISDLSRSGFFIDILTPLAEGSLISFRFILPEDETETPIKGEGIVAWQRPLQGMGVRITKMSEEDRNRLAAHLSRD